jgi:hypothetical protein
MYNMQMKFKMMNSAMWRVRDKHFADYIGSQITTNEVDDAIDNKRSARATHSRGQILLGAIDAVCRAIAHTNEAARIARRDIETMQHHFGCPTFFLTVTPDDDNHILIQIYSQTFLSPQVDIDNMTDEEIFRLSNLKTDLRIAFPGICAFFFEAMLNIVLHDVTNRITVQLLHLRVSLVKYKQYQFPWKSRDGEHCMLIFSFGKKV